PPRGGDLRRRYHPRVHRNAKLGEAGAALQRGGGDAAARPARRAPVPVAASCRTLPAIGGSLMDTGGSRPMQHILVATDFSDTAEAALDVAIGYARRFGARLHVLHVF